MIFNPGLVPQASGGGGCASGTYVGNGAYSRTFTFPFEPSCVILLGTSSSTFVRTTVLNTSTYYTGMCEEVAGDSISSSPVNEKFNGNSITMTGSSISNINSKNTTYVWIAFPKA